MFNDRLNVNDFMLGIEFQGDTGKRPLTDQQIQSAVEYLKPIILKYRIPLSSIVTHENVRDAYNEYATKNGMKKADRKVDINYANY
jgi:N-acetyl-anhydromuramyl-L-alanine amidase AmpD